MDWQPIDWLGLIGGVVLLFAFWRVNSGVWKVTSAWYELDSFVASAILLYYTWQKHAYVNIVLNLVWAYVALRGLTSVAERRAMRNPDFRRGYRKARASKSKR